MENKPKILIVDDVDLNREMLETILEDKYDIYHASNGQQAIDMIKSKNRNYRLMLLDLEMPVLDGYQVLEFMRDNDFLGEIPVIIITSDVSKDTMLRAYSLGAVDVFQKPFITQVVLHRIDNTLSLYKQSYRDQLTGSYNRRAFIDTAHELIVNASDVREYSIIYLDIKNFKAINELFGTDGGDIVLKRFYEQLILRRIRPILASRLEADHFACIIRNDSTDLQEIASYMEETLIVKDKKIRMFASFGVYHVDDRNLAITRMIDRAKLALAHIRDESIKPYAIYDNNMQNDYVDQAEVLSEFEEGIEKKEFVVYFQPVMEAATGKMVSAEALVRWIHPTKGFVSPATFIPALEKNGYISRLDRYVLETVRDSLNYRVKNKLPVVPVSVNLSWMDFYDDATMCMIIDLFQRHEISKDMLRLEVTETSYAVLEQNRKNLLENLRRFGAVVLLDDFGSGYSSFGMLEEYDFDILKIDMSFIRKIGKKAKSKLIIQSIIEMCHRMGLKTVAEGAETQEQVDFLRECGCDYIQGYYYSKPLSGEDFAAFVEKCYAEDMIVKQ